MTRLKNEPETLQKIGNAALASDVEKAFLQVRLHIKDVRCHTLLVGKTDKRTGCSEQSRHLSLRQCDYNAKNKEVAREIDNNAYVYNVIITAKSTQEVTTLYEELKKKHIAEKDLGDNTTLKIPGISWNAKENQLHLTCKYPAREKFTKRTVSEQVASVYDQMEWLTPITLHGKRFLQQLWKCDCSWDVALSQAHQEQWEDIINSVDDFNTKYADDLLRSANP
ncbi:hypothetical protein RB195_010476 [Necator americanus]|uniref:Uncharacterized protein n=1 Tax=Necator americanus TaxID=51031 RepID=A0ABR1CYX1_NECAM